MSPARLAAARLARPAIGAAGRPQGRARTALARPLAASARRWAALAALSLGLAGCWRPVEGPADANVPAPTITVDPIAADTLARLAAPIAVYWLRGPRGPCEAWSFTPARDDEPARLERREGAAVLSFRATLRDAALFLTAPHYEAGGRSTALPCTFTGVLHRERRQTIALELGSEEALYLDEDACRARRAPPIRPLGCAGALADPTTRARLGARAGANAADDAADDATRPGHHDPHHAPAADDDDATGGEPDHPTGGEPDHPTPTEGPDHTDDEPDDEGPPAWLRGRVVYLRVDGEDGPTCSRWRRFAAASTSLASARFGVLRRRAGPVIETVDYQIDGPWLTFASPSALRRDGDRQRQRSRSCLVSLEVRASDRRSAWFDALSWHRTRRACEAADEPLEPPPPCLRALVDPELGLDSR